MLDCRSGRYYCVAILNLKDARYQMEKERMHLKCSYIEYVRESEMI